MSNPFPQVTIRDLTEIVKNNLYRTAVGNDWQPIGLLGMPGGGKTHFFKYVLPKIWAEHLSETSGHLVQPDDIDIIIVRIGQKDAQEIVGPGVPFEEDGIYVFQDSRPPVLSAMQRGRTIDGVFVPYKYRILLWDEIAQGQDDAQQATSDSFDNDENGIGAWKLPPNTLVVGTGNRASDKAGSRRVIASLIGRGQWYELLFDVVGFVDDYAIPNNLCPIMIDFVQQHWRDAFVTCVPTDPGPFGTPRSMVNASYDLAAFLHRGLFNGSIPRWLELQLAGNVGTEVARMLVDFIETNHECPTAAEIFSDPENAAVSALTGFQMVAATTAMARVTTADQATALLTYIMRLRGDLQVSLGVELQRKISSVDFDDDITSPLWAQFNARYYKFTNMA